MAYADNLMNTSQNFMTPDFVNKFSTALGQPVEKIQSGLKSIIPAFLMGLVSKGSSSQGANTIVNLVNDPVTSQNGDKVVNEIFGAKLDQVTTTLGQTTGLGSSSVNKLMGMLAPLILGVVGSKIRAEHLDTSAVQSFFTRQRSILAGILPGGLAGMFGLGAVPNINHAYRAGTVDANRKGAIWALIAFIILALFGVVYWLVTRNVPQNINSVQTKEKIDRPFNTSIITQPTKNAVTASTATVAAASSLGELGQFLASGNSAALPKRFAFKNLNFALGTATLGAGSSVELDQIAAAMKQYPQATARVEGFTDNTGPAELNQKLSQQRALTVRNALIERGVASQRLSAAGRGSETPLANNDTPENMAMNRRIEFVITGLK